MEDSTGTIPAEAPVHGIQEASDAGGLDLVVAPAFQNINGVKIYPPSFIPAKSVLHTPKKALVSMDILHIEGIHIAFFLGFTFLLFIGMWKRPNLR